MDIKDIKLIIWDLDETFWRGTISEGEIVFIEENIAFLKKTTDMGIVHSICSKNSYDIVKECLVKQGIWDYFVLPDVSWESKGGRIKHMIDRFNLRAANVLFIDDNIQNLEEAKFFCGGIMTSLPSGLLELYSQAEKAEATDIAHKRLSQYKLIERKEEAKRGFDSNEDFLFSCNIRVEIDYCCRKELDRVHDLIIRSNQLNYTKNRQSKEQLLELIDSPDVLTGCVSVSDKFGEYGIVGFFAVKDSELIHFTFSCRTLGMRVEQYVYRELNCPEIRIVGEVAAELNNTEKPLWINQTDADETTEESKEKVDKKILLKGPCDMSQIFSFICENKNIITEFSYTNDAGVLIEGHNHTAQIVTALCASEKKKQKLLSIVDYFDEAQFSTAMEKEEFDYVVLSMLTDGNLGLYRTKDGDECVALCEKYYDLTCEKNKELYINKKIFTSNIDFTEDNLDDFSRAFSCVHNDGEVTVRSLEEIVNKIGKKTKLILLLGSEREFKKKCGESFANRHIEHQLMNCKIREWAKNHDNVILISFDDYIKSDSDYLDTINHFVKRVYYSLACDLVAIFNSDADRGIGMKGKMSLYKSEIWSFLRRLKHWLKKHIK